MGGLGCVLEVRLPPAHVDVGEALRFLYRQISHVVADDLLSELANLPRVILLCFSQTLAGGACLSATYPSLL